MKQTKIVATIGPVTLAVDKLTQMMQAGMNVCRLNFSHSDHAWHKEALQNIRTAQEKIGLPIAIIADLQGPRIRTLVENETYVKKGEMVLFCEESEKKSLQEKKQQLIAIDKKNILSQLKPKQPILIEDGKIGFILKSRHEGYITAEVTQGGTVKNHKGMNFPNAHLDIPALTKKDEMDLAFALENHVDYVALSFVSSAENIQNLRKKIQKHEKSSGRNTKIIVKVEKQEAIDNLDAIIAETDAVMVARGDLATEAGQEMMTVFQKEIIEKSLAHAKPVIVATQMLESMMENSRPTRAEISDVAHAVMDHTDGVMLSGETAGGKYPLECIQTMASIIRNTEESRFDDVLELLKLHTPSEYSNMLKGAYRLTKESDAKAIAVVTKTGESAQLLSHFRPEKYIYAITNSEKVYNQLALVWGVKAFICKKRKDETKLMQHLFDLLQKDHMLKKNDQVVSIYRDKDSKHKKVELKSI